MPHPTETTQDPLDFDALWDYAQPAQTEERFLALRPSLTNSPDRLAELDTQIARTQGLRGRFTEAHATLDALAPAIEHGPDRLRVRYLLERGRVFNSSGDPAAARPLFEQAWALAVETGEDFHAIDAAHMVAIVGSPEEQLPWNRLALELANASADERARRWAGSLHNNIGWTQFEQGDLEDALASFHLALAVREAQGAPGPIRIARWSVAKTLRALGRVDEALAIQTALLAELDAAGESDGYVHQELAACYRQLGRMDEATEHEALAAEQLGK